MKYVMPGYEKRKVTIDLLKHFSTLSIAVLALSAAFLGNLSQLGHSNKPIIFSVSCFFAVVVCSSLAKYILVANIEEMPFMSFSHYLLRLCVAVTFFGFFGGAGGFLYMVIQNA